jgi:hypothetical protein
VPLPLLLTPAASMLSADCPLPPPRVLQRHCSSKELVRATGNSSEKALEAAKVFEEKQWAACLKLGAKQMQKYQAKIDKKLAKMSASSTRAPAATAASAAGSAGAAAAASAPAATAAAAAATTLPPSPAETAADAVYWSQLRALRDEHGRAVAKVAAFVLASSGGTIEGAAAPMVELYSSCQRVEAMFAETEQPAPVGEARIVALRKVALYLKDKLQPIHANVLRAEKAAAASAVAAQEKQQRQQPEQAKPAAGQKAPKRPAQTEQQAQREKRRQEQAQEVQGAFKRSREQTGGGTTLQHGALATTAATAAAAAAAAAPQHLLQQKTPLAVPVAEQSASDRLVAALKK